MDRFGTDFPPPFNQYVGNRKKTHTHTPLIQVIPERDTEMKYTHTQTKLYRLYKKQKQNPTTTTWKSQENKCWLFGYNPKRETKAQGSPIIVLFQKQSFWIKEETNQYSGTPPREHNPLVFLTKIHSKVNL